MQWSKASSSCVLLTSPLSAPGTVNQNNKPVVIKSGQMCRPVLTENAPVNLVQSSAIASLPHVHSASPSLAPCTAKQANRLVIIKSDQICRLVLNVSAPAKLVQSSASSSLALSASPSSAPCTANQANRPVIIKSAQICRPVLNVNAPAKLVQSSSASSSLALSASPSSAPKNVKQTLTQSSSYVWKHTHCRIKLASLQWTVLVQGMETIVPGVVQGEGVGGDFTSWL